MFLLLLCNITTEAQKIQVFSADDNMPIPSAHIQCRSVISGSYHLYITDQSGMAFLEECKPEDFPYVLNISYLGFGKIVDTVYKPSDMVYFLKTEKISLNEVVITAQYAPNSPEKAVHNIRIIDEKKIEAMGAQNLKEVLANEMNIRLSQDNILGSSMSMQGVSGQNIKVLIDGVPVIGRLNGNIDISQINMNNVERIEIIEGPLSVAYGTDALGGTINIITKKVQKSNFSIASNNHYESNGTYNFDGRIAYRNSKSSLSLSGGRNFFDGWRKEDKNFQIEKSRVADSSRFFDWKPKEQYFGSLFYGQYFNNLQLSYTAGYFYEIISNKGIPRPPFEETAFDDYYRTYRFDNSLKIKTGINKLHLELLFAHNRFKRIKNTYFNDLTKMKRILTENPSDQDTSSFKNFMARGTLSSSKSFNKFNYQVGYDINIEKAFGLRLQNNEQQIGDYALFATAEYMLFQRLIIRPGLRFIYNSSYDAPLVPSINFKYSLSDTKEANTDIRFSYARGFRSPSVKELYFDFVDINHYITGNENLQAEQSHNFNFSIRQNRNKGGKAWKNEASLYYNQIHHMISLAQHNSNQFSYFNIDNFQSLGFQVKSEFAIQHFKFAVGGGYLGQNHGLKKAENDKEFTFSPEAKASLSYEWHEKKLNFSIFYKYTGQLTSYQNTNEGGFFAHEIEDYHSADASISRLFFKEKARLTIGVKNIFDVKDIVGTTTSSGAHNNSNNGIAVAMGRNYFLGLNININSKN